ncbi:hypothetical protein [Nocardioides pakistanensis]
MHAWVKCVLVTLATTLLVASGATASPAPAAEVGQAGSTAVRLNRTVSFAGTTTAQVARQAYARLARRPGRVDRVAAIKRLPDRLGAPVVKRSLTDRNHDGRDDDGQIAFTIGQRNQSCLTLDTGKVRPGNCMRVVAGPLTVQSAAALIHRTLVWFDRHHSTYRMQPTDVALVRQTAAKELPASMQVTFTDADGDRRVDAGRVLLADTARGACMAMYLPEHDPNGAFYGSGYTFVDCP